MSPNPRYKLLGEQILDARGEDITIGIAGIGNVERLSTTADSIVPEAACTSTQFHVQTSPDSFAAYWNASQAIAAIQLALGANSPYLLGKELWRETRIPLFEQATDTRSEELKAQGVRPRVWFGERWINSVFDLFEENVRYFPALLPITDEEDPLAVLEAGGVPALAGAAAAQRHDLPLEPAGLRHRRRECRTCASRTACSPPARRWPTRWPTPRSTSAWSGRWPRASGRCGRRCRSVPPRRTSTSRPSTASTRRSTGPGSARSGPPSWSCAGCCPLAHEGLAAWGVDSADERPAARHHRAALPARDQRRRVVRAPDAPARRTRSGSTRCGRRCSTTASGCTPTSRSHTWD